MTVGGRGRTLKIVGLRSAVDEHGYTITAWDAQGCSEAAYRCGASACRLNSDGAGH